MQTIHLQKAALLTLLMIVVFIAVWEKYWRSQGFPASYNDDEPLWANKRKEIYRSTASAPVIIGSSRIKFDVDIATWEKICGQKPVQLALVGTSPRPILKDLADDVNFKGFVLVDVTEASFFTQTGSPTEARAKERVVFYPKWSPAQQASFGINRVLESNFVFLDDKFSLTGLLPAIPFPRREGIKTMPVLPREWSYVDFNRQTFMGRQVIRDTALLNQVKKIWIVRPMAIKKGPGGDTLKTMLDEVKLWVDKIKARGGKVLFVRTPSSGPYWEQEKKVFPREHYWDRLLAYTHTGGIHFEDYPELSRFQCPEWSHLTHEDAVPFTASFVQVLRQYTSWWSPVQSVSSPSSHPTQSY